MERPTGTTFYKKLKELDPKLDCYLNYDIKRARNLKEPLWCITYERPLRDPIIVRVIHDGNYGFRQPNPRDLEWLHSHDMHRDGVRYRLEFAAKLMEEARDLQEQKQEQEFRDMTKDGRYQIMYEMNKALGAGKGAKHVRQVIPKSKGYTVKDLRKLNNNTNSAKE